MAQKVTTIDDALQVYRERDLASATIGQVRKGTGVQLGAPTVHEGREWIEATLEDGAVGYVLGPAARSHTTLGGALLRPLSPVEKALKEVVTAERNPPPVRGGSPQRLMLVGALVCAAGIMTMVATRVAASRGHASFVVVPWGAILFGAIGFIVGLARWIFGRR